MKGRRKETRMGSTRSPAREESSWNLGGGRFIEFANNETMFQTVSSLLFVRPFFSGDFFFFSFVSPPSFGTTLRFHEGSSWVFEGGNFGKETGRKFWEKPEERNPHPLFITFWKKNSGGSGEGMLGSSCKVFLKEFLKGG